MKLVSLKYKNDDCMYKFRTKRCCNKKCKKGKGCFNIHSRDMSRRVPKQIPNRGHLFNYIPHACPEYKDQKKCAMGKECFLAHGWLEIIFHPLLFKTKLCESSLKNGVCRKYGIYCTKAHNENEVRNLVKIYGKDWKRHYEAHQSESVKPNKKKVKHEPSKHSDLTDSSPSGSVVQDNVKSAGLSDYSSHMYGGSPLFVPTPSVSPCQSIGLCSETVDCLPIPSIDLSDFDHLSSVECGEVGMYSKICNDGVVSKTQGTNSLFNDRFSWAFDWSTSNDTSPKESVCSRSGSDDLDSSTFKESGSRTSGSISRMSDVDTELLKPKEDYGFMDTISIGMTNSDNLPKSQEIRTSMQDFDQQDWELRLKQEEHTNQPNIDSICPPAGNDECEILVD